MRMTRAGLAGGLMAEKKQRQKLQRLQEELAKSIVDTKLKKETTIQEEDIENEVEEVFQERFLAGRQKTTIAAMKKHKESEEE
jgi:hypothetical protein